MVLVYVVAMVIIITMLLLDSNHEVRLGIAAAAVPYGAASQNVDIISRISEINCV